MLTVNNTTDMDLVKNMLFVPEVWDRAAEDGVSKESYEPSYDGMTVWLECKKDDEVIGIILVHVDTSAALKIHPYLLKKYRFLGREMMEKLYEWFLSLPENINKIITVIPENQRKVYNFAKKVGFKDEGFNRESYMKNGKVYGQWYLGITRNEIEEHLK